jgi:heme/copper-type cytochrome/quinol oxidase subunit 4
MKHPFKLSKTNKVYLSIACGFWLLASLVLFGFQPYTIGYAIGGIIFFAVIPIIVAWLVWLIQGKKEEGGTTAFNVVLTLLLISSLSNFVGKLMERDANTTAQIENLEDSKASSQASFL